MRTRTFSTQPYFVDHLRILFSITKIPDLDSFSTPNRGKDSSLAGSVQICTFFVPVRSFGIFLAVPSLRARKKEITFKHYEHIGSAIA